MTLPRSVAAIWNGVPTVCWGSTLLEIEGLAGETLERGGGSGRIGIGTHKLTKETKRFRAMLETSGGEAETRGLGSKKPAVWPAGDRNRWMARVYFSAAATSGVQIL